MGKENLTDIKVLDADSLSGTVAVVVGTRPGIVMFAPIIHELERQNVDYFVIHTGQHYSPNMDAQFFRDLDLPESKYKLTGVKDRTTHGGQTAAMLEGIEEILLREKPRFVLVGGDANTNLAGALAARKLRMGVGHVEAGERSYDWRMPEEHNRRIIDHISDHLFATNELAVGRLEKEAVIGQIHVVGNPIVDASLQHRDLAENKSEVLRELGVEAGRYGVLTTHREENVDFKENLQGVLSGVSLVAGKLNLPVIFTAHPRTLKRLQEFALLDWADNLPGIRRVEALGYLDFISLLSHAHVIFTDSGGVQQEACIHKVPAVTLRENTEWVETLDHGANRLAGTDPARIVEAALQANAVHREWPVPFGDGYAAKRIVEISCQVVSGTI